MLRFYADRMVAATAICQSLQKSKKLDYSQGMTTQAKYADLLLRDKGYGGLYDWAMSERRRVQPPSYDVLATRLAALTEGQVDVSGFSLRKWLVRLEIEGGVIGHE